MPKKSNDFNWNLLMSILKEWANQSKTIDLLKKKSNAYIIEPDMQNEPHIIIEFPYTNAKEWEKVKELFNL